MRLQGHPGQTLPRQASWQYAQQHSHLIWPMLPHCQHTSSPVLLYSVPGDYGLLDVLHLSTQVVLVLVPPRPSHVLTSTSFASKPCSVTSVSIFIPFILPMSSSQRLYVLWSINTKMLSTNWLTISLNFAWVERMAFTLAFIFSWPVLVVAIISSRLGHTAASIFHWTAFTQGLQLFTADPHFSWAALITGPPFQCSSLLGQHLWWPRTLPDQPADFPLYGPFPLSNSNSTSDTSCLVLVRLVTGFIDIESAYLLMITRCTSVHYHVSCVTSLLISGSDNGGSMLEVGNVQRVG